MVERGNFLNARRAPSGPDIEQHDLASEIGETSRLTLIILKADGSTWFGRFVYDEICRQLLGKGDRHRHKHHADRSNAIAQAVHHGFRSRHPSERTLTSSLVFSKHQELCPPIARGRCERLQSRCEMDLIRIPYL